MTLVFIYLQFLVCGFMLRGSVVEVHKCEVLCVPDVDVRKLLRGAIVEHCHRDASEEHYRAWEVIIIETPTLGQHLAILAAYI